MFFINLITYSGLLKFSGPAVVQEVDRVTVEVVQEVLRDQEAVRIVQDRVPNLENAAGLVPLIEIRVLGHAADHRLLKKTEDPAENKIN